MSTKTDEREWQTAGRIETALRLAAELPIRDTPVLLFQLIEGLRTRARREGLGSLALESALNLAMTSAHAADSVLSETDRV